MDSKTFLNDKIISGAFSQLIFRADKRNQNEQLLTSFVDIGILERVNNKNNQIIFGRRGTGKTHLLKMIQLTQNEQDRFLCSYVDFRKFGSLRKTEGASLVIQLSSIFKDLFSILCFDLRSYLIKNGVSNKVVDKLNDLEKNVFSPETIVIPQKMECQKTAGNSSIQDLNIGLTSESLNTEIKSSKNKTCNTSLSQSYILNQESVIYINDINNFLEDILNDLDCRFIILLDEWSELPLLLQPYFAELIKKCFFANRNIIIKIAAMEYRSKFRVGSTNDYSGFELGCDIFCIDLDSFFVFDKDTKYTVNTFENILYRHLYSELPPNYFLKNYSITDGKSLIEMLFTNRNAFEELVMASEGIIRDFISITLDCFYSIPRDSNNDRTGKIGTKTIRKCAARLYIKEKDNNLSPDAYRVLTRIIGKVIGEKHARAFMVSKEYEKNPLLMELFDSRVIHLLKTSYSDKSHSGERYSVFTLDYGTYVELMNTKTGKEIKASKKDTYDLDDLDDNNFWVPMEDNRSIRTIILLPQYLTRELLDDEKKEQTIDRENLEYQMMIKNASIEFKKEVVAQFHIEHNTFSEIYELFGVKEAEIKKWVDEIDFSIYM